MSNIWEGGVLGKEERIVFFNVCFNFKCCLNGIKIYIYMCVKSISVCIFILFL